jgi:hypothetical protein
MIKEGLTRLKAGKVDQIHIKMSVWYGNKYKLPNLTQMGMSDLTDHWLHSLSECVIWEAS